VQSLREMNPNARFDGIGDGVEPWQAKGHALLKEEDDPTALDE